MKTISLLGSAAAALLSIALSSLPSHAQEDHAHGTTAKPVQGKSAPNKMGMGAGMGMGRQCEMMMKSRQEDEATTKAQDAKLKQLTTAMNQASETKKSAAMAAVINELVTQRTARQVMMKQQQRQMMAHMQEHMKNGSKMSMMQCPMMTPSGGKKTKGMMGMGMGMGSKTK